MFLADINFWLALAFECHCKHESARHWFEGHSESSCCFCRMTQQGFLRLSSNPSVFGEEAVSLIDAWAMYDALLADFRVRFLGEPEGVETLWRSLTQRATFSPKVWNDAFLAAFAQSANVEIVTFDQAFSQYAGVTSTVLS